MFSGGRKLEDLRIVDLGIGGYYVANMAGRGAVVFVTSRDVMPNGKTVIVGEVVENGRVLRRTGAQSFYRTATEHEVAQAKGWRKK